MTSISACNAYVFAKKKKTVLLNISAKPAVMSPTIACFSTGELMTSDMTTSRGDANYICHALT